MEIENKQVGNIAVLSISGRIDAVTSRDLESALTTALDQKITRIVIDLKEVDFISSGGIRVFVSFKKRLIERKGDLVVSSLQPFVMEIFEMTGLPSLISVHSSQSEAIKSFQS